MVRVGNFTVRLVSAETTKDPFKEHTAPDGKTFVEAEPDAEYFIECAYDDGKSGEVDDDRSDDGSDDDDEENGPKMVLLNFIVDGKELGYHSRIYKKDGPYHAGIWSYENGTSKMNAFSFRVPTSFTGVSSGSEELDVSAMFGTITVKFFEAIPDGILVRDDFLGDIIQSSPIKGKAEKALRSGEGTTSENRRINRVSTSYTNGKLLQTIQLNYCTALGLIHAKILPMPDVWTWAKMKNPIDTTVASEIIPVEPQRIQRNGVVVDGKVIEPPTECDFFDLTVLPDDDEKKQDDKEEDEEVEDEVEAEDKTIDDDEEAEDKATEDDEEEEDKAAEDEEEEEKKATEDKEGKAAEDEEEENDADNLLVLNDKFGSLALGNKEDLESIFDGREEVVKGKIVSDDDSDSSDDDE